MGLDNKKLLAAAAEQFDGFVDVPNMLNGMETPADSHNSLHMMHAQDWQISHRTGAGDDEHCDDDSIYIYLGKDSEEDVTAALQNAISSARNTGFP